MEIVAFALQVDKIRFLRKFQMPHRVRAGCCSSYHYAQSSSIYENAVDLKVIPFVSCYYLPVSHIISFVSLYDTSDATTQENKKGNSFIIVWGSQTILNCSQAEMSLVGHLQRLDFELETLAERPYLVKGCQVRSTTCIV